MNIRITKTTQHKNMFLVILFVLLTKLVVAQSSYPVRVQVQLYPPHSVYLEDYTSIEKDKFAVTLTLNDQDWPTLDVRLRLSISGGGIELATSESFMATPITLHYGVPLRLTGAELAQYFNPMNMTFQGISKTEFMQNGGKLPEGIFIFRVRVFEARRMVEISNPNPITGGGNNGGGGSAIAWPTLHNPPMWITPSQNEVVTANNPQHVLFTWLAMHSGAFSVEYEFQIVEIWPENNSPEIVINTVTPLYTETVRRPRLVYGPDKPPLEPGKKYACRIKAKDAGGASLFKNQGYSEVLTFTFGKACKPPLNVMHKDPGKQSVDIQWDAYPNNSEFVVQYREKGQEENEWYEDNAGNSPYTINKLNPGKTYEYKVKALCGSLNSAYSQVKEFKTEELGNVEYDCDNNPNVPPIDDSPALEELKVNDKISIGGFQATVTEVKKGTSGFTGKCTVSTFWVFPIQAKFENIRVNQSMQVTSGNIIALKEQVPGSLLLAQSDLSNIINKDSTIIKENATVENITRNKDDNIVVHYSDGTQDVVVLGNTVTITDAKKDKYVIKPDGSVTKNGKPVNVSKNNIEAEGGESSYTNNNIKNKARVWFSPVEDINNYGFDSPYPQLKASVKFYEDMKINGESYKVAWKSLEAPSSFNRIKAAIEVEEKDTLPYEIQFKSNLGSTLTVSGSDNEKELNLIGQGSETIEEIMAWYSEKDSSGKVQEIPAGKIKVKSYEKIRKKIMIVPVNGNKADMSGLINTLNSIYRPAVTEWEMIDGPDNFEVDLGDGPFDDGTEGMYSNYTADMEKVISTFFVTFLYTNFWAGYEIDDNTYIMFLVKNPKSGDILGAMPFKHQFGFIFIDNTGSGEKLYKTIAHELGHGAFRLRHPFKEFPNMNDPENLMNYSGGKNLRKYQWDYIHDPTSVIKWEQEEWEYSESSVLQKMCQEIRCNYVKGNENINYLNAYVNQLPNREIPVSLLDKKIYLQMYYNQGESIKSKYSEITSRGSLLISNTVFHFGGLDIYVEDKYKEWFKNYINPTPEQIENDFKTVKMDITTDDISFKEYKLLKGIAACASMHFSAQDRYNIIKSLAKGANFENEEDLILDLMSTAIKRNDVNDFVTLWKEDIELCKKVYKSMENFGGEDNFTRFLYVMYVLWLDSEWSDRSKYNYDKFPYEIGFYPKGVTFEGVQDDDIYIKTHVNFKGDLIQLKYSARGMEDYYNYYEFFQPVQIIFSDKNIEIRFPSDKVPMFFVKGIDDDFDFQTSMKYINLGVDVITLVISAGYLTTVSKLPTALRWAAIIIGTIEITAQVADMVINYTNVCKGNEKLCGKLRKYCFWLQMGSFAGDVVIQRMLRNSAKEAFEQMKYLDLDDEGKAVKKHLQEVVNSGGYKTKLLRKFDDLENLENLKTWVDKLDDVTDARLLSKLDELDDATLLKLNADIAKIDGRVSEAANLLKNNLSKVDEDIIDAWKLLDGSPVIRLDIKNLENLKIVVKHSNYSYTANQISELKGLINNSSSKSRLIKQLRYATKYSNDFPKVGDLLEFAKIAPVNPVQVKIGINEKIGIIGRNMKYVKVHADELKAQGKIVEIFDINYNTLSPEALNQWNNLRNSYAPQKIPEDVIRKSKLFIENEDWIKRIDKGGYEIRNLGNPGNNPEISIFFNMEKNTVQW